MRGPLSLTNRVRLAQYHQRLTRYLAHIAEGLPPPRFKNANLWRVL